MWRPARPPGKSERGIALVAVLWGVALLAVIAGSFANTARTETLIARNLVEWVKAAALAEAGVYRGILGMLDPVAQRRLRDDGHTYSFALGEGEIRVAIQDEGGKIDLNAAPDVLLRRLFQLAGLDDEASAALAAAVADWRDEDDLRRPGGAENQDYRGAGLDHGPKNRDFEAIEELQQVLGVSRALYQGLAPALTVHSGRASVNTATAPPLVLRSLPGMDEAAVRALLDERERALRADLPADPQRPRAGPARSRILVYTIHAEARTTGGASVSRDAVVSLGDEPETPFLVLAWRRGESTLFAPEQRD
jgi:general secretion pathway protein K